LLLRRKSAFKVFSAGDRQAHSIIDVVFWIQVSLHAMFHVSHQSVQHDDALCAKHLFLVLAATAGASQTTDGGRILAQAY
jgi:hypothetical protein